ncbi:tripartite tricarboxylate transporter substrate binding protein [Ramlibacter sp. AW1]|uniref:Tripartite tricarboxylate transporter substrate binding protein n=1 Tax=Ramlibacter aurantiacus TaxID=2801330 RepID=A0A937D864_9BURK|nr:tripartite tricarboxylate transporter substrate binding protein [Ramlibacter aurantiacus]MBL0422723.1 tripartite tricarboxylate transporter substrate binding protein [Ramlibacter aurantiacus]
MSLQRRHFNLALAALAVAAPLGAAQAQNWPSRPIRLIVPFGAGGATDIYARIVGQHLQAALGQPVVIENRPGGNFAIGTEMAAKAAPDGHTLVMITSSHSVLEAMGINRSKYQLLRDLVPVATLSAAEGVLVVHPSVPANNLKEFIALAKSKPGQINYASTGTGSMLHLQGELMESMAGVHMVHIPYKTGGSARVDLLEGRVQAMFHPVTGATQLIREGKLRALGVTGSQRSPALPEVPTIAEAGLPGYDVPVLIGVAAPAGTPRPIVERLNTEISAILRRPDVQEAWAKADSRTLVMSPEQFKSALESEITKWGKVIREARISME